MPNNSVLNLEWCTHQYNTLYSKTWNYGIRHSRVVLQFTKDGIFVAEYESAREASRQTGVHHGQLIWCCNNKLKTAGGYVWKYKED